MRHYMLLLALQEQGTLSKAAEHLSLSQPTVTKSLANIEAIFSTPLFRRTRRGLEPTESGKAVLARARLIHQDHLALERELDAIAGGRQGQLRIGLIQFASDWALRALLRNAFAQQPPLAVLIHEDSTPNLMQAVLARELDCAICRFSQDDTWPPGAVQRPLYEQRACLVVGHDNAAHARRARRNALDLDEICAMDWIVPSEHTPVRQVIGRLFSEAGRQVPAPRVEISTIRALSAALRRLPRGITVAPDDVAHLLAAEGAAHVLPYRLPWGLPPVGLFWSSDNPQAALIEKLWMNASAELKQPAK